MIMPIDIDKKEFTRDKRGYNSREVDEFLDLIVMDYEKVLNDNRAMAHKIKSLEKQLEEAQKSDNAMVDTLQTAKKLMADIAASAERRAELMIRDAELEAELEHLDNDDYSLLPDMDRSDFESEKAEQPQAAPAKTIVVEEEVKPVQKPIDLESIFAEEPKQEEVPPVSDLAHATISDLSESLKKMAAEPQSMNDTIILK